MSETTFYQKCLREEMQRRCEKNPRYSARAFARALDVDVGALSRILAGKQIPSMKVAEKVLEGIELSAEDRKHFLGSLSLKQKSRDLKKPSRAFRGVVDGNPPKELSVDLYRVIADWYHAAILELTFVAELKNDARAIASKLGISAIEAKLAIQRLMDLGLLDDQNGVLTKSAERFTTADKHLSTPALRRNQRQFLEKAIYSLENDPIDERSVTSMTMAINPENIPAARQMIREFNQNLCQLLETGNRTRVYNLGVALCPLQLKEKK
jgi:uncharacterized protein (TIGR02147 family)